MWTINRAIFMRCCWFVVFFPYFCFCSKHTWCSMFNIGSGGPKIYVFAWCALCVRACAFSHICLSILGEVGEWYRFELTGAWRLAHRRRSTQKKRTTYKIHPFTSCIYIVGQYWMLLFVSFGIQRALHFNFRSIRIASGINSSLIAHCTVRVCVWVCASDSIKVCACELGEIENVT